MRDCECVAGTHCVQHETCRDRGERCEWVQRPETTERLIGVGRYDVAVMKVKRFDCVRCDSVASSQVRVA